MAELSCPGCGRTPDADEPVCPVCISPYVRVDNTRIDPADSPGPARPAEVAEARVGEACADPDCPTGGTVPTDRCPACWRSASATAAAVTVRFPWGDETVPTDDPLPIGREHSPLATRLADYPNVGRRHAQLSLVGGNPVVVDLSSSNGTFVNGTRVQPMRPHPLQDGDTVRFAATLSATVHFGRQQ